jgi:hypothetical protein
VTRSSSAARSGFVALVALAVPAAAQDRPIEDNSFLVEEAYNQEDRVVQHVLTVEHAGDGGDWELAFTQEWPVGSRRHQFSFSVPYARLDGETGLSDASIDYRFQLWGSEGGALAAAPRVSVLLPSGEWEEGRGAGAVGFEANLPLSLRLTERWVGHWNAGGSWTPDARLPAPAGGGRHGAARADLSSLSLGQGLVWLLRPSFNALLETVWSRERVPTAAGVGDPKLETESSLFVAPGARWAIDRPSGLQIVPGVAIPIGVGPSAGEWSVFLYLSFEHPF